MLTFLKVLRNIDFDLTTLVRSFCLLSYYFSTSLLWRSTGAAIVNVATADDFRIFILFLFVCQVDRFVILWSLLPVEAGLLLVVVL